MLLKRGKMRTERSDKAVGCMLKTKRQKLENERIVG